MNNQLANLPFYLPIVFFACIVFTYYMFYKATRCSKPFLWLAFGWIVIQGVLAKTGFYMAFDSMPPRFLLAVGPPVFTIILLFTTAKGKAFIAQLDLKILTVLHSVRIAVEFCLLWLFLAKAIPQLMTFEGRNFDILAGITAPVVYYLFFVKKAISNHVYLVWNIAGFLLLMSVVVHAFLSAPFPFQQLAFNQPNIGVLYFPYILLPSFIVPLVLFSHLVAIKRWREAS